MKILIATDGSDYSTAAVAEACKFVAQPETTEIKVVSAYEDAYPITAEPFALSAEYYQKIEEAVREQAAQFTTDAENEIKARFPNEKPILSSEVLRGSADREIIEFAKSWKADLIVVGSHGRGFWGRMLGSVSDGVVHHAPCSVLVVRTIHH